MGRLLGALAMVLMLYLILIGSFEQARSPGNHRDLARYFGFYGVLTLGVGMLIITGGIDLSIGSLVGLSAVCFGFLLERGMHAVHAATLIVLAGATIGMIHGLLITQLNLQPFLVTLCGLFMYRGLARRLSNDSTIRLHEVVLEDGAMDLRPDVAGLRQILVSGDLLGVPHQLILMMGIGAVLAVFLHRSVYGRYFFAIGYNEQAARYAGISTDRYRILAYVICSTLAGLGGVLFLLGYRLAQPSSAGSWLELYAITGAVLGGCSLRGGEGTVAGMLLGAAVLPLLQQICVYSPDIGNQLEYSVIGAALLLGTIANEVLMRRSAAWAK